MKELEEVTTLPAILRPIERSSVLLVPVMDVQTAMSRLQQFQEFCAHYLQESSDGGNDGGDYGVIPGTKKKTLFKSGADKLAEVYGLYDEYVLTSSVEDWERGLFDYSLKCLLKSRRDDSMVGTGVGSCSTFESKYRWRDSQRSCPKCKNQTIIKGKEDFGGGWLCWTKKGGCGAKFKDGDASIESQTIGRVDNPDIIDLKNTALKMAKKRAKIDAVIGATRSSGTFAQDLDDIPLTPTPKPPPPVTTEDIEIGGHGKPADVVSKGPTTAPEKPVYPELPVEESLPTAIQYISVKQASNLHMRFRDSLKGELQPKADTLLHDFLKFWGFVDEHDTPTAKAIPVSQFAQVGKKAIEHAKSL